jgi:hypothetical protein
MDFWGVLIEKALHVGMHYVAHKAAHGSHAHTSPAPTVRTATFQQVVAAAIGGQVTCDKLGRDRAILRFDGYPVFVVELERMLLIGSMCSIPYRQLPAGCDKAARRRNRSLKYGQWLWDESDPRVDKPHFVMGAPWPGTSPSTLATACEYVFTEVTEGMVENIICVAMKDAERKPTEEPPPRRESKPWWQFWT